MADKHSDHHDHGYETDRVPPDLLSSMGYETRDVGPRAILVWISGLFVFIAIVSFGTLGIMNTFIPDTGRTAYESEIYRTRPIRNEPPQPQLQVLPKRDMIMYRRDEKRLLDGYANTSEGRVSVPIGDAIDAIAAEGISGVKGEKPAQNNGYPGSRQFKNSGNSAEAPKEEGRATDSITEERKNVPNEPGNAGY
ncbi:MAG: hypothetical protein H7Y38_15850 [Armatimonadetes bacterium]|nr:hypothetical protein [Armatimonadota bacterium]